MSGPADARALAEELRAALRGEVLFDDGSRALYATDASNYRQVPIGVVRPLDSEDLERAVELCRRHGAPLVARGAGTSLAGQCCNVAVVLDLSRHLNRILEIDPEQRRARVQPGVVLDTLRSAAERHGLTFGPDPATHSHCTLGGMIGNNSCGVHSIFAGKTVDNVEALEVLTYDGLRLSVGPTGEEELERIVQAGGRRGSIYAGLREIRDRTAGLVRERYPRIPRRVSGYNLDELLPEHGFHVARALVGSEGTCVTVLEATLRLVPSPPGRVLLVLGYPDVYCAADAVPEVLSAGPIGLEGMDKRLIGQQRKKKMHGAAHAELPEGEGWLLVEFGGADAAEAEARARRFMDELRRGAATPSMRLCVEREAQRRMWEVRESALGSTARTPGEDDTWEGFEDAAVAPERLGQYLRELHALVRSYGYDCALYGHFGDGCVHNRINFDLKTRAGIEKFRAFMGEAADLVVSFGGSLSGEHGDGQARAELLPKMFGPELVQAFADFKRLWDPDHKMNPGKLVHPYRMDENLRLGTDYRPLELATELRFPADSGSFARAVSRCVGMGKCRKEEGGTMCPSFRATHDERHSTRGRANLLFEMLRGEVITTQWRSEEVREALDLCLACKGCKRDCPVSVDMASYKAEFLHHHYRGRLRPRSAYALGLVGLWARIGSRMPRLANLVAGSRIGKLLAGIAPSRQVPAFARQTFKGWFAQHRGSAPAPPPGSEQTHFVGTPAPWTPIHVLLWPDTFTNHFAPHIGQAAVEVLEDAGFRVELPPEGLCCGRPLYDSGMLRLARRQLRQILDALRPAIAAGVPLVGLEPSCLAVFRDELGNLFPNDEDARRLGRQCFTLAEILERAGYRPPRLEGRALVHGHCHHKAVLGFDADRAVLEKLGLDLEILDSGCCGMAGAFGFEREHAALSSQIGELVLLPAVRRAPADVLIVTDGFSCREQIAQGSGRRALHLAEVLALALRRRS
jgi:FAD/FMN-containing dehydrogenase/Fe-S oxidoreductase